MTGTELLLILAIVFFGIASAGCILWADELTGICEEIGRLARRLL